MKSLTNFLITLVASTLGGTALMASCQNYRVIEKSRVTVELKNTKHDRLGELDEIELYLETSINELDSSNFFSDFLGVTIYKVSPDFRIGSSKNSVPFQATTTIFNQEVDHALLYNKFLNLLVIENDIEVPIASGSIEVPIWAVTGGNHDDLIFSKSIQLTLSNLNGEAILIGNEQQDAIKIAITPSRVSALTEGELQGKIKELLSSRPTTRKEIKEANARLFYLDDLLQDKILDNCVTEF